MSVLASVAFVLDAVEPVFVRLLFHLPLMCTDDDEDEDEDEDEDDDDAEGNRDGDVGTGGGISVKK